MIWERLHSVSEQNDLGGTLFSRYMIVLTLVSKAKRRIFVSAGPVELQKASE